MPPPLPRFLQRFRRDRDPEPKNSGALILCSDDHELRADVTASSPSELPLRVADDARQAWDLMRSETPVAVIVDLQTGSAGGFALARDMSQTSRLVDIPVVLLLERAQDQWLAREAGAALTVTKPVDVANLLSAVRALVDGGRAS